MSNAKPLVSKDEIRQIALQVHDENHLASAAPFEVGSMIVAMNRLQQLYEERITELQRTIAYIDDHAPRADETCEEPGITLSEAARRALKEQDAK